MTPSPPSCLVFDFDGTLADTFNLAWEIFNELSSVYGYRKIDKEDLAKARDMTMAQFIKAFRISRLKIPKMLKEGKRRLAHRIEDISPIEGIQEVLPQLREQYPTLGILTSNSKQNVSSFLKQHDLDFFDFISTVPKLSGKAKSLRAIMRTYTLDPVEVIYVGDESRDMKAALKAGVHGAGVMWGFNSEKALRLYTPKWLIKEPKKLLSLRED
ncbi:MAG: HAD-IA family hydrolase [Verrucomicrobiota bacterium]